jgi:hypothetical protein
MQVFDFNIHPKLKKGHISKSFYFEDENDVLGDLCIIGELDNCVSKDIKILQDISGKIKESFFENDKINTETAFEIALEKGNKYLRKLSSEGNVRWLGNMNIAVIAIKDSNIYFSKNGGIKMILLRNDEYHDIAEHLEQQTNGSSYFSNTACGELIEFDKLFILTKSIYEFFELYLSQRILRVESFKPQTLPKLLKEAKEDLKTQTGIIFFINALGKKKRKPMVPGIRIPKIKINKEYLLIISLFIIWLIAYLIFKAN